MTFRRLVRPGALGRAIPLLLAMGLKEADSPMRLSISLLTLALIHLSDPAVAVMNTYSSTAPNGAPGDRILYSTSLCPAIQTTRQGAKTASPS